MSQEIDNAGESAPSQCGNDIDIIATTESVRFASTVPGAVSASLDRDHVQAYCSEFCREYLPVGPTETALVNLLARHAAAMERWDEGGRAIEREAAQHLPKVAIGLADSDGTSVDGVLAGCMTTEAADRCERNSVRRSRAFLLTLEKLESIQAARREREGQQATMPLLGFADEAACEQFLVDRLRRGAVRCPECRITDGCLIVMRKCWECRGCKKQIGLRANTVMARSAIPLRQWFDAIRWILWRPTIGVQDLSARIGLARSATVRSMMIKIRTAMAADDASDQLAGLDRHFARESIT